MNEKKNETQSVSKYYLTILKKKGFQRNAKKNRFYYAIQIFDVRRLSKSRS